MALKFVYFGRINAPNGASTFFNSIYQNKDLFSGSGTLDVQFYTLPNEKKTSTIQSPFSLKKWLRAKLMIANKHSLILTIIFYYLTIGRHAKHVINKIEDYSLNDTFFFNDIYSCYYFCKFKSENVKFTIILHDNGDPTKMFYDNFPKFKCYFISSYVDRKVFEILNKSSNIVLLSESAKTIFLSKYNLNSEWASKCVVIKNGSYLEGVNLKENTRGERPLVGVCVGSVSKRKGYDLLISAINNVPSLNIIINCIGPVLDDSIVKSYTGDKIIFKGVMSKGDIAQSLYNSDFFILCSRDEGMPIAILEAMQYKLPIFATNVGAIPELLTNDFEGVIFDPNVQSIEKILIDIDNEIYDLFAMSNNSYNSYIDKYSISKMINQYVNLLK